MNLSIPELETILSVFNKLQDQNSIDKANGALNEWRESLESLPMALEIVQNTSNMNLFAFAATKIRYNLDANDNLDEQAIKTICEVCIGRILQNRQVSQLEQNYLELLFEISAIAVSKFSPLFEAIMSSNQLLLNEQTCFLYYLLTELSKDKEMTDSQQQLKDYFWNNNFLLDILRQGIDQTVSHFWVLLYCCLPNYFEPYTKLSEFLPQVQIALTDEKNISTILNFFEHISDSNDPEDLPFLKDMISIMIEYAKSIFVNPNHSGINYASFIWLTILDSNYDFFVSDIDFTDYVFKTFIEIFLAFQYYNPEDDFNDFFNLLDYCTSRLGSQAEGAPLSAMTEYISTGIDFIIEQIDLVSDLTMPREDNLTPFCFYGFKMDQCLKQIMRLDSDYLNSDQAMSDEFNEFLINYFKSKILKLTNGVLYAFSFTPKFTRRTFSNLIGVQLVEMPKKLITSVYFISSCCEFTSEIKNSEIELTFAISELDFAPQYKVSDALLELSKYYSSAFIEKGDLYIQTMLKMIEIVPISEMNYILPNLFAASFNVLFCLQNKFGNNLQLNSEQQETIKAIDSFFQKARDLFIGKVCQVPQISDMSDLLAFCDFIVPIIDNSNNFNGSMSNFYSSLFEVIEKALIPAFDIENLTAQTEICDLLILAFKNNWIANKEPYLGWIETMLFKYPIPKHLIILSYLVELLPSQKIVEYLTQIEVLPIEILENVILFLVQVILKRPEILTELVNFDQLLSPFNKNTTSITSNELSLLISLMSNTNFQIPAEDADKIAQISARKAFSFDSYEAYTIFIQKIYEIVQKGVQLMRLIGIRYNALGTVLNYILEVVDYKDQIITDFANSFMQNNISNEALIEETKKLATVITTLYKQKNPMFTY